VQYRLSTVHDGRHRTLAKRLLTARGELGFYDNMYIAVHVLPVDWSLAQITAHSLAANDGAKRASVDASTYTEVFGMGVHVCAALRTLTGIAATETGKFHQVLIAGTYQLEVSPVDWPRPVHASCPGRENPEEE
jgi:hypothetical protein